MKKNNSKITNPYSNKNPNNEKDLSPNSFKTTNISNNYEIKNRINFSSSINDQDPNNSKDYSYISARDPSIDRNELEKSMLELKHYIEVAAPTDSQSVEETANTMSFRPKNLPKKSKEEAEYHRKLVEENRKLNLKALEKKHLMEIEKKKKLEKKINFWENEILANWQSKKFDKKIKKYFYEGIPNEIRGKVWMLCLGNRFSITKEYYQIQVSNSKELLKQYQNKGNISNNENNENEDNLDEDDDDNDEINNLFAHGKDKGKSINVINLDIERTFPYLNIFKGNSPKAEELREILGTFVISRPDIGYIQGMSFIAGILLINMNKLNAFISLMNLILNPIMLPFYQVNNELIQQRLKLFKQVFYVNLPDLCGYFDEIGLLPENYFLIWNMTLFSHDTNLELANRIWDVFMIEGVKAIYSAAIVILMHFEDRFVNMDFSEIMICINNVKNVNFNEDSFINAMQKVKIPGWVQKEIDKLSDENIPIY